MFNILQAKKSTKLVPVDASEYGTTECDNVSCLVKNFGNLDYDDDLYILSAADEYNGYNVPNSDGGGLL